MASGGRVDDHDVEAGRRRREADDFKKADQLVDAGDGELQQCVYVVPIEPGAVLDDVGQRTSVGCQPARKRLPRIELRCAERAAARPNRGDPGCQRGTERVAK